MTHFDPRKWNPTRRVLAVLAALACGALCLVAVAEVGTTPSPSFVTRSGDKLMLNGRCSGSPVRTSPGAGLTKTAGVLGYPSQFQVNTALATVADMGGTVVRCHTCGISTGNPQSVEPSLGTFNTTALDHIDYFVAQAGKDGIRLDIPLVDAYNYYVGGYHNFTDWLGLSTPSNCPSAACASQFYTNPRAIAAYEQYISVMLNHVNVYTGVANKDNPTIMSWETGNELSYGLGGAAEFTKWTSTISAYIKSIAPQQLVMDGSLGMDPGDLKLPDVDIEDPHFYPLNTSQLATDASQTAAAGKALVVGEYAWNGNGAAWRRSCPSSRAPPASAATCTGTCCRRTTTWASKSITTAISCTSPATPATWPAASATAAGDRGQQRRVARRAVAQPCLRNDGYRRPGLRRARPRRSSPMWNGWPAPPRAAATSWNGGVSPAPRATRCAGRSPGQRGRGPWRAP